jgi:hypothetical protein
MDQPRPSLGLGGSRVEDGDVPVASGKAANVYSVKSAKLFKEASLGTAFTVSLYI